MLPEQILGALIDLGARVNSDEKEMAKAFRPAQKGKRYPPLHRRAGRARGPTAGTSKNPGMGLA